MAPKPWHNARQLILQHEENSTMIRSRRTLLCLFVAAFAVLFAFTVRASQVRGVFDNASLMSDVWFQVTLLDAYLGFITVYVWIAWKEQTLLRRILWFVLVMVFGNMAVSAYILMQLMKLPADANLSDVLTIRCVNSNLSQSTGH